MLQCGSVFDAIVWFSPVILVACQALPADASSFEETNSTDLYSDHFSNQSGGEVAELSVSGHEILNETVGGSAEAQSSHPWDAALAKPFADSSPQPTAAPTAPSSGQVLFGDQEGDVSVITGGHEPGTLKWCVDSRPNCTELRLLYVELEAPGSSACQFRVSSGRTSDDIYAVISQPPPSLAQRAIVLQLLNFSRHSGVATWPSTGPSATAELMAGRADRIGSQLAFQEPPLSFPLAYGSSSVGLRDNDTVVIRLPARWRIDAEVPCVVIVERPEDCGACSFPLQFCNDQAAQQWPDWPKAARSQGLEELLSIRLPRPSFALSSEEELAGGEHNHSVCIVGGKQSSKDGPRILGRLQYYALPRVTWLSSLVRVGIRTFLNPGWHREIGLQCENCSQLSRIAVRRLELDKGCKGVDKETLTAAASAARAGEIPVLASGGVDMTASGGQTAEVVQRHRSNGKRGGEAVDSDSRLCPKVPLRGPCHGFPEASFTVGFPVTDFAGGGGGAKEVTFRVDSNSRLQARERQALFHHRSAICFYPDESMDDGWLVGFATVHLDGFDMQAFIGFVCFFGVALPLVCLATFLLHHNKYELCAQHLHRLRLDYQRSQLERELAARGGGASARRSSNPAGASSSSSTRDAGARDSAGLAGAGRPWPRGHLLAGGLMRDHGEASVPWLSAVERSGSFAPFGPPLPRVGGFFVA